MALRARGPWYTDAYEHHSDDRHDNRQHLDHSNIETKQPY